MCPAREQEGERHAQEGSKYRLFRPSARSASCRAFPGKQQKLSLADLLPVATDEPGTSGLQELEDLNQMIEEEELVEALASILEECGRKHGTATNSGSEAEMEEMEEGQRPPQRSRCSHRAVCHPRPQTESMWAKPQRPKTPRTVGPRTLVGRMRARKDKHPLLLPCECIRLSCTERQEVIHSSFYDLPSPDAQRAWAFRGVMSR